MVYIIIDNDWSVNKRGELFLEKYLIGPFCCKVLVHKIIYEIIYTYLYLIPGFRLKNNHCEFTTWRHKFK